MNDRTYLEHEPKSYQLFFRSLFQPGRGYAFACDAQGHVDLDAMGERERADYFYARGLVGRELQAPTVRVLLAVH
jgi:hypothetical protein